MTKTYIEPSTLTYDELVERYEKASSTELEKMWKDDAYHLNEGQWCYCQIYVDNPNVGKELENLITRDGYKSEFVLEKENCYKEVVCYYTESETNADVIDKWIMATPHNFALVTNFTSVTNNDEGTSIDWFITEEQSFGKFHTEWEATVQ